MASMPHIPSLDRLPSDLKRLRRWVTWKYVKRRGRATKKPQQRIDEPRQWLTDSDACERVVLGTADGVGFVLGDGIVCIDLDNCIGEDGTLLEIARDAIELATYVERSPSGRGLHVWIRAGIARSRNIAPRNGVPRHEIYDGGAGSARYITITGDRVGEVQGLREGPEVQAALDVFVAKWFPEESQAAPGAEPDGHPSAIDDNNLLQIMFSAKGGAKCKRLYDGDHSDYPSQSEGDLGLIRKLRFYTRGNSVQIDRLFRQSGLMRAKWHQRRGTQTYGESTIAKALALGGPLFAPRDVRAASLSRDAWERKAWARTPAWVYVRLGGAGELACRVYGIIACCANKNGEAWPSVERIAGHLRISDRRVKSAIAKLKAARLLTSAPRPGTSNLYRLTLTVPETITPYALRGGASGVTESGHLGCRSHGMVTSQELTIDRHRRERDTRQQKKSTHAERKDAKRTTAQPARSLPEPCIPPAPSARTLRTDTSRSPCAGRTGPQAPPQVVPSFGNTPSKRSDSSDRLSWAVMCSVGRTARSNRSSTYDG